MEKAESRAEKAESRKQKAESRKQKAESTTSGHRLTTLLQLPQLAQLAQQTSSRLLLPIGHYQRHQIPSSSSPLPRLAFLRSFNFGPLSSKLVILNMHHSCLMQPPSQPPFSGLESHLPQSRHNSCPSHAHAPRLSITSPHLSICHTPTDPRYLSCQGSRGGNVTPACPSELLQNPTSLFPYLPFSKFSASQFQYSQSSPPQPLSTLVFQYEIISCCSSACRNFKSFNRQSYSLSKPTGSGSTSSP